MHRQEEIVQAPSTTEKEDVESDPGTGTGTEPESWFGEGIGTGTEPEPPWFGDRETARRSFMNGECIVKRYVYQQPWYGNRLTGPASITKGEIVYLDDSYLATGYPVVAILRVKDVGPRWPLRQWIRMVNCELYWPDTCPLCSEPTTDRGQICDHCGWKHAYVRETEDDGEAD